MDDNAIHLHVKQWYAWAPGVEDVDQWQQWVKGSLAFASEAVPALPFIKPMLRRRLSQLSKMAVKVAFECLNKEGNDFIADRTVFCSRHGELTRTVGLLEALASGDELSPTGFSLSVHNAASGLYSIARGDTKPSVSIAAGRDTLIEGMREAAMLLAEGEINTVLVIVADEPLPSYLLQYADEQQRPFALAILLSKMDVDKGCSFTALYDQQQKVGSKEPQSLEFIRFMLSGTNPVVMPGARCDWQWQHNV